MCAALLVCRLIDSRLSCLACWDGARQKKNNQSRISYENEKNIPGVKCQVPCTKYQVPGTGTCSKKGVGGLVISVAQCCNCHGSAARELVVFRDVCIAKYVSIGLCDFFSFL